MYRFTHIKQVCSKTLYACCLFIASGNSYAHFQEIIPDRDFLNSDRQQPLNFAVRFTHPMTQGPVMNMQKPKALSVFSNGTHTDLLPSLKNAGSGEAQQWSFTYRVTEPGDLSFFVEPQPYWEESEGKMIIHYAKVIVDGYGDFNGWDQQLNFAGRK